MILDFLKIDKIREACPAAGTNCKTGLNAWPAPTLCARGGVREDRIRQGRIVNSSAKTENDTFRQLRMI
ncbi:hypothetical protein J6590_007149 [Homalodisca vitripennis]|nr:hypothetical protein J6590_007149 [Homalodisca vitripennis]